MTIQEQWRRELLRRALAADPTATVDEANAAVALVIRDQPAPAPDDAFLRTLPGLGEALAILDQAVDAGRLHTDAALSMLRPDFAPTETP